MNIGSWLQRRAVQTSEKPALFLGANCVASYQEFDHEARAIACSLIGVGVQPGDRVAIFLKNTPEYLSLLYGIWYAGAAAVPINAKLHEKEVVWILNDSVAKLVFTGSDMAEKLAAVGPENTRVFSIDSALWDDFSGHGNIVSICERRSEDLAWLFYTSGTTGQPKGVMISHGMLISMAHCYFADVDHVSAEDHALYAAPLSHGAGLYNVMHVLKGAAHVFPKSGGFDPSEVLDLAEHFGSTHMFAAPTIVKRLTAFAKTHSRSGKGLRSVIYAGGPMYQADIIEAVAHFGAIFIQIYGQGECPMGISALSRADVADRSRVDWGKRLASVGTAQSGVEIKVLSESGASCTEVEIGEILVRGTTVMKGYWNNPDATAKTLVDGWLYTGDKGFLDRAGFLTLVDRSKDVIITGGSNVYPREVEEVLLTHPSISEVSVVGQADPEWGEVVIAFVVAAQQKVIDIKELETHCLNNIARFKRPKRYVVVNQLPKNNYGKVLKTDLRKMLAK